MQQKRKLSARHIVVPRSRKFNKIYKRTAANVVKCGFHVGTNNLVTDDAKVAAKQKEDLIIEAKRKAENVAVSSIIKRYDNKGQHSQMF